MSKNPVRSGEWCDKCEKEVVAAIVDWMEHYRGLPRTEYLAGILANRIRKNDWKNEWSSRGDIPDSE